ncbi:MAG: PepSY domain-containing protein [Acidimicrobiia bacterium]
MQRARRWTLAAVAAGVVVVVAGGAGVAISQSGEDQELTGDLRDRAVAAALTATGGGTVTETEMGDDGAAYGVEVLLPDGRQVEVNLDRDLNVIGQEPDDDRADNEVDDD